MPSKKKARESSGPCEKSSFISLLDHASEHCRATADCDVQHIHFDTPPGTMVMNHIGLGKMEEIVKETHITRLGNIMGVKTGTNPAYVSGRLLSLLL